MLRGGFLSCVHDKVVSQGEGCDVRAVWRGVLGKDRHLG